jgi:hypothetical protein
MALQSWLEGLEIEPDGTTRPYEIVSKDFHLHPVTAPDKDFPHCCKDHFLSFQELTKWANTFLPEAESMMLAKKTLFNLSNTESFILFTFNQDDWYEEISDFIEYNIFSFGSSINHAERYLMKLGGFIKTIQIPNNYHKSRKLDDLILLWLKNSMFSRDLFHLRKAFDKWFYSFPFELSFLSELKDKYDLFFGIVNDDFTDFDDSSFMVEINKMTDAILYNHNTSNLYKQKLITDPAKLKFELIASQRTHKLNNENFYGQNSDSDPEYRRMIQKWFKDEIKFVDAISKLLPDSSPDVQPLLPSKKSQENSKGIDEELPSFESLFQDEASADASLKILKNLERPVINESNVYIGYSKGVIPMWISVLKVYPDFFRHDISDLLLSKILNSKIIGLNLSKDASEFRTHYARLKGNALRLEMKTLFSQFVQSSQSSHKGKLGK